MMNTPTDKEVRDWYMGYGVEGRAELAEVEGDAFDRYLLERDARVSKATEERIIKLLEDAKANLREKLSEVSGDSQSETYWYSRIQQLDNYMALIKGEK